jgi:hypothetical protein
MRWEQSLDCSDRVEKIALLQGTTFVKGRHDFAIKVPSTGYLPLSLTGVVINMRKRTAVAFVLAGILIALTGRCAAEQESAICATTPPEDSSRYEEWAREVEKANCEIITIHD